MKAASGSSGKVEPVVVERHLQSGGVFHLVRLLLLHHHHGVGERWTEWIKSVITS